jgi:hypothetical protein
MKYNHDLGEQAESPTSVETQTGGTRIFYPSVHLSGDEELDLPEEGTITFKFKIRREASSKGENGKLRYECDLDLTKLVAAEGEKDARPSKRDTSAEDSLDKLMKGRSDDSGDEDY